jgi:hypothetical protein
LTAIAAAISGVVDGDGDVLIEGVAGMEDAAPGDVIFIEQARMAARAASTAATAVIAPPGVSVAGKPVVHVADPRLAFVRVLELFQQPERLPQGIAATARIGAGVELGAVGTTADFRDSVIGVASANGYYHVTPGRWEKFDPFGTVGYSLLFRNGTANAVNYGAGLNYWFKPGLAARVEFRDHYAPASSTHFWGFRFGLSFSELWP